jgi:hypothetical protein
MALIKAKARQNTAIERVTEGNDTYLKSLRDGTLTVANFIAALSLEGRVFTANVGTATSPVTFGAGGLDATEFDLHVSVPAGSVIIPLELRVVMEAFGTAAINEILMIAGGGSTCGAGTAITPVSSNVNMGRSSSCTVTSAATATSGVAITTNVRELYRDGSPIAITIATVGQVRVPNVFLWRATDSGILDVVGPSQQVAVLAAANAGTGFITLKYVELPVSAVN